MILSLHSGGRDEATRNIGCLTQRHQFNKLPRPYFCEETVMVKMSEEVGNASNSDANAPQGEGSGPSAGNSSQAIVEQLERLNRENREITALYNIGVAVGSTLRLKEVIWTLYKDSSRLTDTSNFAVAIHDDSSDLLYFALALEQGKRLKPMSVKVTAKNQGLTGQVLTTQNPLLIQDVANSGSRFEIDRSAPDRPIRSWLGVPILNPVIPNGKAQGVIAIWNHKPNTFTEHDLWLLSAIGTQAAIAIRNARLFESSQRRATEMAFLNEVARTLSSTLQLDEVLTRIMEQVDEMLQVEAGSLLLTDPATGDLFFQIALGHRAKEVKPFRIPRGQGIAGEVAITGRPLLIANVQEDERHFKELGEKVNFNTRNMLCVPLRLYDQVIGVLQIMNKKSGSFNQHDLELLESIASYAAIAIENARLHESVLAERDRVIEAQEQARKELARDLHDGPTQLVAGITMSLDFCKKALEKDPSLLAKELNEMQELAERASRQMRTMLFELRPLVLETHGLGAALRVFLDRRQQEIETTRLSLKVVTYNQSDDISRQDAKVEAAIFAIVQETVNNALKHARAENITVHLKETPKEIYTIIADDGVGFDLDEVMSNYEHRGSLGMINIRERTQLIGGELTMNSTADQGTQVVVRVPKEEAERMKKRGTGPLSLPAGMIPGK